MPINDDFSQPLVVYPTSFPELDQILQGGMRPGEVYTFLNTSMSYEHGNFRAPILEAIPGNWAGIFFAFFGENKVTDVSSGYLAERERFEQCRRDGHPITKCMLSFVTSEVCPSHDPNFLKNELAYCRRNGVVTIVIHDPEYAGGQQPSTSALQTLIESSSFIAERLPTESISIIGEKSIFRYKVLKNHWGKDQVEFSVEYNILTKFDLYGPVVRQT